MRIVTLSILVDDSQAAAIENHMKMEMADNIGANISSMGAFLARRKNTDSREVIIDFKIDNVPATADKIVQITKLK